MASTKAQLKLARDLIGKKDYRGAHDAAKQVLNYDPSNYNGLVFLGLASLELGDLKASEDAYQAAIRQNEVQPLAWQGIAKLYERRQQWDEFVQTQRKLANLFSTAGDAVKCAEAVSRLIDARRQHASRRDLVEALSLLLEGSPYYAVLSGLPEPDASSPTASTVFDIQVAIHNNLPVLEEIILLTEQSEEETIAQEIQKRRTRLDAPPLAILRELVKREIWSSSKLERLYEDVLNHPRTSDTLRRTTEASLLNRKRERLWSLELNDPTKQQLYKEVADMVAGMVLIKIPNELAWSLYFDMTDVADLHQYKLEDIRALLSILPQSPLAQLWKAWMRSENIPESEDEEDAPEQDNTDPLDVVIDLWQKLPNSILLQRVTAQFHWRSKDYQNAISTSETALRTLGELEKGLGVSLKYTARAINVILACSLVHYYPPKYHTKALRLLDGLLDDDPSQPDCLTARGYIHEQASRWEEAKQDFDGVMRVVDNSSSAWIEAAEESAWCQIQAGDKDKGRKSLEEVIDILDSANDNETAQARAWWRLGRTVWDANSPSSLQEAYKLWITALKRSSTFAPAYTSLGIYYADFADPKDAMRASKCFQKAFELDAREAEAARRLAEGFVEEQEWELAEIVARRTIEGEGAFEGDQSTNVQSRHLTTNTWAWKVAGLVALNKQDYPEAIKAFQVSLRAISEDSVTWLRLGEAYAAAGRHTAGLRALNRARQQAPDDFVCQFQIAEVTRELGDYQASIEMLGEIIKSRPNDLVAHAARCTTRLALARSEQEKGFLERAYRSCVETLEEALVALELEGPSMRVLWKVISDVTFELARRPIDNVDFAKEAINILTKLLVQISEHTQDLDSRLVPIIQLEDHIRDLQDSLEDVQVDLIAAKAAIASSSYCIHLAGNDDAVLSSAYYDLSAHLYEFWAKYGKQLDSDSVHTSATLAEEYIKRAIRLRSNEPLYWTTLGILSVERNPKLSQHAFITAIQCEPKDPALWCNLGMLYIRGLDSQLAQEAFHRAQVLDPDYAMAWVGQAIVAGRNKNLSHCVALLEHAVSLSADMPIPNLEFAYRTFNSLESTSSGEISQSGTVVSAFFSLERCLQRRPNDVSALHLAALISERLNLMSRAAQFARRCATLLEAAYERSEDPETARQYAITQSTLGRILLAENDYTASASCFETVLSLVDAVIEEGSEEEASRRLRANAHLGLGLANLLSGEVETAISNFETGLEEAPVEMKAVRTQLTILLAQTMWMVGSEEARDMAKSLLLDCVSADSKNLQAMVVLGAIATLLNDDTLLEAALSEIISMQPKERRELDRLGTVDTLLVRHHLLQGSLGDAVEIARKAVELDPENEASRLQLCETLLRQSNYPAALQSLRADSESLSTLAAQLRLLAMARIEAEAEDSEKSGGLMQQATHLTPWDSKNWAGLAYIRSKGMQ